MPTLDEYRRSVEATEAAILAPLPVPAGAIDTLIDGICGEAWASAEQRALTQGLVARLERLKHRQGEQPSGPPPDSSKEVPGEPGASEVEAGGGAGRRGSRAGRGRKARNGGVH